MDNDCDWWVDINDGAWKEDDFYSDPYPYYKVDLIGLVEGKIYFYRFTQVVYSGGIGDIQRGNMKWFIAGQSQNHDPVAVNDAASVLEGSSVSVSVLLNSNALGQIPWLINIASSFHSNIIC